MMRYVVHLALIISVAMAAGSIILSSRLRSRHHHEFFSSLFYYLVFIFAFGFYGMWGHAVVKLYLESYLNPSLIARITDISTLLGLPFLVFAWLMLLRFSCFVADRKCTNIFVISFLVLNFSAIIILGSLLSDTGEPGPSQLIRWFFIVMNFTYSVAASYLLLTGSPDAPVSLSDRKLIITGVLSVMIIQGVALIFYTGQLYLGIIFIIVFFTGNSFLPVYFTYGLRSPLMDKKEIGSLSFGEFCKRYDISPRESDIIREICNGLSNKEISEKLFISLQTVKDHTHRIYIKTNVRSRLQLMKLVKGQP